MISNNFFFSGNDEKLYGEDGKEFKVPFCPLNFPDHDDLAERIRKTLYYGKLPKDDRPSLPMTGLTVDFLRDAAPRELGKIDMYWASDVGRKAFISPCSLMLGMIYIERLKHKNPDYLNTVSSSDLFLISMMVASKYLYDEGIEEEVYNDEWADSANMDIEDVNTLEREFLTAIDWSLFTKKEDFEALLEKMEERIALSQGIDRGGYWSYTDLMILLSNAKLNGTLRDVMAEVCRVVLVCSVAYTAGTLTVLGSVSTLNILRSHLTLHSGQQPPLIMIPSHTGEGHSLDITVSQISDNRILNTAKASVQEDSLLYQNQYSSDYALETGDELLVNKSEDHHQQHHNQQQEQEHVAAKPGLSFPGFLTLALIKDTVAQFLTPSGRHSSRRSSHRHLRTAIDEEDLSTNSNNDSDPTGTTNGKPTMRTATPACTCPNCPGKASVKSHSRKNKATSSVNISCVSQIKVPPYSFLSTLKYVYKCCGTGGKTGATISASGNGNGNSDGNSVVDNGEEDISGNPVDRTSTFNSIDLSNMLNLPFSENPSASESLFLTTAGFGIKISEDVDGSNEFELVSGSRIRKCKVKNTVGLLDRETSYLDAGLRCQLETSMFDLTSRFGTSSQVAMAG